MVRVAWCVACLPEYYVARLVALRERRAVDLHVVQISGGMRRYPWFCGESDALAPITLFPEGLADRLAASSVAVRLLRALRQMDPDAIVVNGYATLWDILAALYARSTRRRSFSVFDSTAADHARDWLREGAKRVLLATCFDGIFCSGSRSHEYLLSLGFPDQRIVEGYDVVDNGHFASPAPRTMSGLPEVPYFLAVARFAPEKNLEVLLDAYDNYASGEIRGSREPWPLVLAGAGPLDSQLRRRSAAISAGAILFPGVVRYHNLPELYQRAGCLVLPSLSEPWGLVVNEALAAGCPVLVSDRCGCVPELVHHGRNGFVFSPHRPAELSQLLARIAHLGNEERAKMGAAGRSLVARLSPASWADRFLDLLARAESSSA